MNSDMAEPSRSTTGRQKLSLPWAGRRRDAVLVACAALTGAVALSGKAILLPIALAYPILWGRARSRLVAGLVAAAYFLAASRGVPRGVMNFWTADWYVGIGLWVAASAAFVLVQTVCWQRHDGPMRILRFAIGMILMALPPFGIAGWAQPITAAGVLFPGAGWSGLGLTFFGIVLLTTRWWKVVAIGFLAAYVVALLTWQPPRSPSDIVGMDMNIGSGSSDAYSQQLAIIQEVKATALSGTGAIVLPEAVVGYWTDATENLWRHELERVNVAVNVGANIITRDGYDNVMVGIANGKAEVLYRERMPVPVSMWRPWESGGASAWFFANPTAEFAGYRIAPLICYEQLIVWPVLQSMASGGTVIVATGNAWWAKGTNIADIQKASVQAWASLFATPLVLSFNQ
jgi:hypothetical protein